MPLYTELEFSFLTFFGPDRSLSIENICAQTWFRALGTNIIAINYSSTFYYSYASVNFKKKLPCQVAICRSILTFSGRSKWIKGLNFEKLTGKLVSLSDQSVFGLTTVFQEIVPLMCSERQMSTIDEKKCIQMSDFDCVYCGQIFQSTAALAEHQQKVVLCFNQFNINELLASIRKALYMPDL